MGTIYRAVGGDELQPLDREGGVQRGDILGARQLEHVLRLADAVPVRRQHAQFHHFMQIIQTEYILYDGRLVHAVGHQDLPARFCDAYCLRKRLQLVFLLVKVIHRTKQHRQVK